MKKRKLVNCVYAVLLIVSTCIVVSLLETCAMLLRYQRTLDYSNVENFCYKIQKAGELIPIDQNVCEKYVVETDRYGSIILTVIGKEGEEVSCEMTPDYQIVDGIKHTTNFKYVLLAVTGPMFRETLYVMISIIIGFVIGRVLLIIIGFVIDRVLWNIKTR